MDLTLQHADGAYIDGDDDLAYRISSPVSGLALPDGVTATHAASDWVIYQDTARGAALVFEIREPIASSSTSGCSSSSSAPPASASFPETTRTTTTFNAPIRGLGIRMPTNRCLNLDGLPKDLRLPTDIKVLRVRLGSVAPSVVRGVPQVGKGHVNTGCGGQSSESETEIATVWSEAERCTQAGRQLSRNDRTGKGLRVGEELQLFVSAGLAKGCLWPSVTCLSRRCQHPCRSSSCSRADLYCTSKTEQGHNCPLARCSDNLRCRQL